MNTSPKIIIISPVPPKRQYTIWKLIKLVIFLIGLGLCLGGVVFVFAFSTKYTEEYACVLKLVKRDKNVLQTVGEPVEPGLFVWLEYGLGQREGGRKSDFSFSVTGPKGQGRVKAYTYRSSMGSSMFITFEGQVIYSGDYYCP